MDRVHRRLRHVCIGVVGAASIGAGIYALWHLATPDQLPSTGTGLLIGVLGLVILPLVAIAAWDLDRRTAIEQPWADTLEAQASAEPPREADVEEFAVVDAQEHEPTIATPPQSADHVRVPRHITHVRRVRQGQSARR